MQASAAGPGMRRSASFSWGSDSRKPYGTSYSHACSGLPAFDELEEDLEQSRAFQGSETLGRMRPADDSNSRLHHIQRCMLQLPSWMRIAGFTLLILTLSAVFANQMVSLRGHLLTVSSASYAAALANYQQAKTGKALRKAS